MQDRRFADLAGWNEHQEFCILPNMNAVDPSLATVLKSAWKGRNHVASGAGIGIIAASILMLSLTPLYEARMIIAPSSQNGEERSLTILNENPSSSRTTSVSSELPREYIKFQQTFREPSAAKILIKYQGILSQINEDKIFRFSPNLRVSNPVEFSDYIKSHVTLDNLGATTSQLLTYRHPDPVFAENFLKHLHLVTDEMIRSAARTQTEGHIAYLQKALRETYNPDHRKALTDELMLEERRRMAISMDGPFAAEILESSSVSAKPVWPKASIIFPLLSLIGAFIGYLVYILRQKPGT